MAALNLKSVFDKLMQAANASAQRLEREAEEFGYSSMQKNSQTQQETEQPSDKE